MQRGSVAVASFRFHLYGLQVFENISFSGCFLVEKQAVGYGQSYKFDWSEVVLYWIIWTDFRSNDLLLILKLSSVRLSKHFPIGSEQNQRVKRSTPKHARYLIELILIVWSKENEISTSMIGTREEPEATRTVAVHMIATSLFYSLKNWSTKLSNKIKQMEEMKPHFYSPYNSFILFF